MNNHGELEQAHRKAIEATVTYQIGRLVLDARHSPKAMLLLPVKLYRLARHYKNIERQSFKPFAEPNTKKKDFDITHTSSALWLLSQHADNPQMLVNTARQHTANDYQLHKIIKEAATIAASSDAMLASNILENLPDLNHDPAAQKQLAFILYTAGNLTQSSQLLQLAQVEKLLSKNEAMRARRIIAEANIYKNGFELPPAQQPTSKNKPTKIMFVCHTSFPHHNNGYAVRTHNIALEIKKLGYDIQCVSRPGYPWDRKDAVELANIKSQSVIEGVPYFRYHTTNVTTLPLPDFAAQAAKTLQQHIEQHEITHVIAASNFVNALPALIAARNSGATFTYDVRGLWEYTTASKNTHWEASERFGLSSQLETLIASNATTVLCISSALKNELKKRGVNESKISIALNGTAPIAAKKAYRTNVKSALGIPYSATVIGFIGSVEPYEGLDLLARCAAKLLQADHNNISFLIVGDGSYLSALKEVCKKYKLLDKFFFTGRVPHHTIPEYYDAIDICAYPRRNDLVCTLVPPLKPLEAMMQGIAVIIPDLPPLNELTGGAKNTAIYKPENDCDFFKKISRLINDTEERDALARKGKRFVEKQRTWKNTAQIYSLTSHI